jgi:hypothetical protein
MTKGWRVFFALLTAVSLICGGVACLTLIVSHGLAEKSRQVRAGFREWPPLAFVTEPASAQAGQNERLGEIIAKLRACVRAHAPEVQEPAAKGIGNAIDYFIEVCSPPITSLDPAQVGAVPPGIFRITITEEWNTITGEKQKR